MSVTTTRDKLLKQFRELVLERIGRIGKSLVQLEGQGNLEAAKLALRELHGLKGEARMMGFAEANSLVHEMEELLRAVASRNYALDPASIDALLVVSDAVCILCSAREVGTGEPPDVPHLLSWIRQRIAFESDRTPPRVIKSITPNEEGVDTVEKTQIIAVQPDLVLPKISPVSPPRPSVPSSRGSAPTHAEHRTVDTSIKVTRKSLELLTASVGSLLQGNRRREMSEQKREGMVEELHLLSREVEQLGNKGLLLAERIEQLKDSMAAWHRESKMFANEELRSLHTLQEEIQGMRLVPLQVLFDMYPRMVRELSREMGKDIDLSIEGEDTRVDRSVLDGLRETLLHLVRNSIDHGLEPSDERVKAGKSPRGQLKLFAQRDGSRLVLRVEDDGRGLDAAKLRTVAVARGLLSEDEAKHMSDDAAHSLVFLSGFSSKEIANDISGRGVGLDAVKAKAISLGGDVSLETQLGQGTIFEVRLPVTTTLVPLLFVRVEEEAFGIAAANVVRAMTIEQTTIGELAGKPAVLIEGRPIPFITLRSILGSETARQAREGELVLVVRRDNKEVVMAVDAIIEERIQAVYPLLGMLGVFGHLWGATPLSDGKLAFVLSSIHLVNAGHGHSERWLLSQVPSTSTRRRRVLLVDDSPLTRDLLQSLLEAVNYEVVSAVDGADGFLKLQREKVDIVVTDLEMPKVDGLELTRQIKRHPSFRSLPVVMVTTRGSDEDRRRGMEAGADGYVTKGDLVRHDLVDVVKRLLG